MGSRMVTSAFALFSCMYVMESCIPLYSTSMGKVFDVNKKRSLKFQNLALESPRKVLEFLV